MESLGNRMKDYENAWKTYIPKKEWSCIRLDGKAFHTWTRGLNKPFDLNLQQWFKETCLFLFKEVHGSKIIYTQSDEITILSNDWSKENTEQWFKGNIQKITSISASLTTAKFNQLSNRNNLAFFDSRVYTLPDEIEVSNYLLWRIRDSIKNSITLLSLEYYSTKQIENKHSGDKLEMIKEKGDDWNNLNSHSKYGLLLYRDIETGENKEYELNNELNFEWIYNLIKQYERK